MYGAIIGDIVGSRYEGVRGKDMSRDFVLLSAKSRFTDDTVMTIAVADALSSCGGNKDTFIEILPKRMRTWGRRYPHAGYGGKFKQWIKSDDMEAYNSFGNGSAMRVSPCGLVALSLNEALELAKMSAEVTHNHPEGIKGAQAIAACIYLAKSGSKIDEIKKFVEDNFYRLDRSIEDMRQTSVMDASCQGTVPIAIQAFIESYNYEDAIRNAVYVGGDTDTIAAMAGSIAWNYYKKQNCNVITTEMKCMIKQTSKFISRDIRNEIVRFENYKKKQEHILNAYKYRHMEEP